MWETLGIEATADAGAIRRAYAARARTWRPETHPQEFSRLREAYEAALAWARHASAPAADAPAPSAAEPEFADTQPAHPAGVDSSPAAPPHPYAQAQRLIGELARDFSESGEAAGVQTLHRQFEAVSQDTVDARIEWEAVLLHSLLTASTPPPVLLFEADRLLNWSQRLPDVARIFGEGGAQRLRVLLDMAQVCVHARWFSPNRWQACLFGAAAPRWFGATACVADASRTAEQWRALCAAAGLEKMLTALDARTVSRMSGRMVLSCDVLFAVLMALVAGLLVRDASPAASGMVVSAWAAGALAIALPMPLLGRWLWLNGWVRRFVQWWQWLRNIPSVVTVLVALIVLVASVVATAAGNPTGVRAAGLVVLWMAGGAILLATATGCWMVLRWCERVVCTPWLWLQRQRGDLRMRAVLEQRGAAPTFKDQLRAIPAAARRDWAESRRARRQQREQARQAAGSGRSTYGQGGSNWWWIFIAIGAVRLLAKLGG